MSSSTVANVLKGKIFTGYYKTIMPEFDPNSTVPLQPTKEPIYFRFSPSAIKTYLRCMRLWGYDYLMGKDRKSSAAATRGKAIHAVVEEVFEGKPHMDKATFDVYLRNYEDYHRLVELAIARGYYPDTDKTSVVVEHEFWHPIVQTPDGPIDIHGFIDMHFFTAEGQLVILDTKTKARLDKYMLNDVTIRHDLQMNIYAFVMGIFYGLADTDDIVLKHVYLITDHPDDTKEVYCIVTFAEVKRYVEDRMIVLETMLKSLAIKDVERLPVGAKSECYKFNGCEYLTNCTRENHGG